MEQIKIASLEYQRDSLLHARGMLAEEDLEKSRARLVSHLSNEASTRQSIHGKTQQIAEGAISVFELEQKYQTEKEILRFNLLSSIDLFLARIQEWKDLYLIQATISGSLTYWGNRYVGQNIQQGEQLFTITPLEVSPSVGVLHIPPTGSGKVKNGQRVLIRLTNYPDHEFGTLEASIHTLSTSTNKEGVYLAEVTFPNGLVTSYKKNLPEDVELRGSAEIITHDRSLLERILSPIYRIFDQSISGRIG